MVVPSVHTPDFLYKYRDDSERTAKIIEKRQVWLATADTLNDPLECKTGLIPENWKRQIVRDLENAQMSGFVLSATASLDGRAPFYALTRRATKRWFKRLRQKKTRKEKYEAICEFLRDHGQELSKPKELFSRFEKQLARVGIFSLAEAPDNPLMWSHYAGNHRGLAFGFRPVTGSRLGEPKHTFPVTYSDSKPTFQRGFINQLSVFRTPEGKVRSEQQIGFEDPTFRAAFSTKPVAWSYEREWRYVEETGGIYPWPACIERVVFGLKMSKERRRQYVDLARSVDVKPMAFYEIAVAPDNASLFMQPLVV